MRNPRRFRIVRKLRRSSIVKDLLRTLLLHDVLGLHLLLPLDALEALQLAITGGLNGGILWSHFLQIPLLLTSHRW